jgi:predicted Zn-dependent peptidase
VSILPELRQDVRVPADDWTVFEGQAITVAPQDAAGQVSLNLIIPYRATRPGLAHYLEHLVFLSAIEGKWGDTNPDTNAVTDDRSIIYTLTGKPDQLEAILRVLAGVFRPLSLSAPQADEERGIVMREYDLYLANDIRARAVEAIGPFLYAGTPSAFSVIGSPDDIKALSLAEAQRLHEDTHQPGRAMLFVTGEMTPAGLAAALEASHFPHLAALASIGPAPFNPAPPAERRFLFPDDATSPGFIWNKVIALPQPMDFDRLDATCYLLADILQSGLSGGVAKPLLYDGAIASYVWVSCDPLDERHVEVFLRAEPDDGVSFPALRKAVESALEQAPQAISPATFERLHKRLTAKWQCNCNAPSGGWYDNYRLRRLSAQRLPKSMAELQAIDATISFASLKDLATRLSAPGRLAVVEIGRGAR